MPTNIRKNSKPQRPIGDPTRENILKAAQKLFAEKGYAGTSISMIAKSAKVNQGLIYHHFHNKEKLWHVVKSHFLTAASATENDLNALLTETDFAIFLRRFITLRFEFYRASPDLRRVIHWQSLEKNAMPLMGIGDDFFERLQQKIIAFQQAGQIKQHYSPQMIFVLLLSNATNLLMNSFVDWESLTPAQQQVMQNDYLTLVIECLQNGLQT